MKFEKIASVAVKTLVVPFFVLNASIALAIDPPANPRGIIQSSTQVQWEWEWVSGAEQFEVTVDGQYRGLTRDPRFTSTDLWPGEHSLRVKAVSYDGQYSGPSITVKVDTNGGGSAASTASSDSVAAPSVNRSADTSGSVSTPANPSGTQVEQGTVQWTWDWTAGASKYDVTVDGAFAGSTTDTQFYSQNLWNGEHSMTVKAVNDAGQISQQSSTIKVTVSDFNGTASIAPPPPEAAQASTAQPAPSTDTGPIDPATYGYGEATKPGYQLTFSDEFNASSLNNNRWNTQLRWDGEFNGERQEYRVINGESQFYVNIYSDDQEHRDLVVPAHNPFELNGSRLAIRAIRNPLKTNNNKAGHGALRDMVAQQDFLSGAMASYDKFTQKYGYFEARIKIPSHVGTFPAFWLHHQKRKWEGTQRTEIDIMENLGHAPWYVYNSFHYFTNVSESYGGDAQFLKPEPSGQIYNGTDFSNDYHTYAVEWEPGKVTWFIDGNQVSQLSHGAVNYEDLYIILNLAIGGNWTNFPTSSGGLGRDSNNFFPNQNDLNTFANPALEIDYVRVYKRN